MFKFKYLNFIQLLIYELLYWILSTLFDVNVLCWNAVTIEFSYIFNLLLLLMSRVSSLIIFFSHWKVDHNHTNLFFKGRIYWVLSAMADLLLYLTLELTYDIWVPNFSSQALLLTWIRQLLKTSTSLSIKSGRIYSTRY